MTMPYEMDQSYGRFMYEEFFKHVNIKKENIFLPDGWLKIRMSSAEHTKSR